MNITSTHESVSHATYGTSFVPDESVPADIARLDQAQLRKTRRQTACIAVSIISNSRLLFEGLTAALTTYPQLDIVGAHSQAPYGAPVLATLPSDVVLLDANLGHETTILWIRHYQNLTPPPKTILLEVRNDVGVILSYVAAGVTGFTFQGAGVAEVVETIEQVWLGATAVRPDVAVQLTQRAAALPDAPQSPATPLTPRELEVLGYIAEGYSNQQIASAMCIELTTVKNHVHNILEKLKLQHRREAARFASQQGWLNIK